MSQTLILPDDIYQKLTQSANRRGLTVEAWLELVTDAAQGPPADQRDRRRGRAIERLLERCRAGTAKDKDRSELDRLIDEEYRTAIERADARIATKRTGRTRAAQESADRRNASGGRASRARE